MDLVDHIFSELKLGNLVYTYNGASVFMWKPEDGNFVVRPMPVDNDSAVTHYSSLNRRTVRDYVSIGESIISKEEALVWSID